MMTRELESKKEIEGNPGGAQGHLNRMDDLPRIWKANSLRLKLNEEINKGVFD